MSKHTPGPWTGAGPSFGDPLPRYTTEIISDWEDEDGEVISICALPFRHQDEENEANARLIAAAPDLLALAYQYANDMRYPPTEDSRQRRLAAVEAVLAKVKS